MRLESPMPSLGRTRPEAGAFEDDVVELALLLPGWQLDALEESASCHGMTTAQMVRSLIAAHLEQPW